MLTGIFHLLVIFYQMLYPIIIQNNVLGDKIYILFHIILVSNWLLFKGECIISYLYKKKNNPNYTMGSDAVDLKDIRDVLPFINVNFIKDIFFYQSFIISTLLIWTAIRKKIVNITNLVIILLSFFYVILRERKFYNKKLYDSFEKHYILDFFNIIIIILLLYIGYKIVLK